MNTRPFDALASLHANNCMQDFFKQYGLYDSLRTLDSLIKAATINTTWKKDIPYVLLYFVENLALLCSAAFVTRYGGAVFDEAILEAPDDSGDPDMVMAEHFMPSHGFGSAWECFPRHLNARQYHNPYKAIKKFCRYMAEPEWKQCLKLLCEYALSNDSINLHVPAYDILTVRLRLMQLIEGCYLVVVRKGRAAP